MRKPCRNPLVRGLLVAGLILVVRLVLVGVRAYPAAHRPSRTDPNACVNWLFGSCLICSKNLLHDEPTLIEFVSALLDAASTVQKGRHNMDHNLDIGCLTQRSQLDRLRELADAATREQLKAVESPETLPTTIFVIGSGGRESAWELDRLPIASPRVAFTDRLQLESVEGLANLVPTQAVMRILRDTGATAAALVAPVTSSAVALQLADADHEQSLTAQVLREPDRDAVLGKWDFGAVAWAVRLRYVLRAAQDPGLGDAPKPVSRSSGPASSRHLDPATARRNFRREMREQLHHQSAPAPSWLQ